MAEVIRIEIELLIVLILFFIFVCWFVWYKITHWLLKRKYDKYYGINQKGGILKGKREDERFGGTESRTATTTSSVDGLGESQRRELLSLQSNTSVGENSDSDRTKRTSNRGFFKTINRRKLK